MPRRSILLFLAMMFVGFAHAEKPKPSQLWFSGRIIEITPASRELVVQRMDAPIARPFHVSETTQVSRRGQELGYDDLHTGDVVTVFYEGEDLATRVEVFPPKRAGTRTSNRTRLN